MSEHVQRHNGLEADPGGAFVWFDDYLISSARVTELEEAREATYAERSLWKKQCFIAEVAITKKDAEIERLRKWAQKAYRFLHIFDTELTLPNGGLAVCTSVSLQVASFLATYPDTGKEVEDE